MRERIRQQLRFTIQSLVLALGLQFFISPVFGWTIFSTAWVSSAAIILGYKLLFLRRPVPLTLPNQQQHDNLSIPNLEEEPMPPKDRILQELKNRNDLLGTELNAIEDKVFHEACIFVELAYLILGEEAFNERYQDSDYILSEIISILPEPQDSSAGAIARKLALGEEAITLLNDPSKAYEDGKTLQGDILNRHTHAFHTLFYWSALHPHIYNLQEKLRDYAKNQWQVIKDQCPDSLVQAIRLFDWICHVDAHFDDFIEDANRYNLEQTLNNRLAAEHPELRSEEEEDHPLQVPPVQEQQPTYLADTPDQRRQRMLEAALRRQQDAAAATVSTETTECKP